MQDNGYWTIPENYILWSGVASNRTLNDLINSVILSYKANATVTATDAGSIATYGTVESKVSTELENAGDFKEIASGDVDGPASSTDNAVARFDGTTGKIIQNSAVTIADSTGDITGGAYNKVTITAPASGSTLTIADGKTLTASNSITLAGTDSTTMTFPGTSASVARTDAGQTFTGTNTFSSAPVVSALTASKPVFTDGSKGLTSSGTLATDQGGTGQASYTAGDLVYYATGTAFTKLAIGASTTILTSSGSAPQWTAASGVTIGTATNLAGGAAGSVPYQTASGATSFLS